MAACIKNKSINTQACSTEYAQKTDRCHETHPTCQDARHSGCAMRAGNGARSNWSAPSSMKTIGAPSVTVKPEIVPSLFVLNSRGSVWHGGDTSGCEKS
jgi:hypothetical protein